MCEPISEGWLAADRQSVVSYIYMRGLFTAFTPWWSTSARPALSSLGATGGCMVIPIQLDANVVTAEIARGDKRGGAGGGLRLLSAFVLNRQLCRMNFE